ILSPGVEKTTLLNKVLIECKRNKINTSRQLDIPIAYNIDGYYLFKFIYKFKNYLPSKIIGPANAYFSERFVRYELENVSLDNKRSEERRVGKECRYRRAPWGYK